MRALSAFLLAPAVASFAVPKAQKVYRAPDSDFIATYREVISDTSGWRSVWALSGGRASSGRSARLPNINFRRKMVIVAAGPAGTPPDSVVVELDAKGAKGVFMVVSYHSCQPSPTKTMPIDIIAVPADPGSVLFRDRTVRAPSCPS